MLFAFMTVFVLAWTIGFPTHLTVANLQSLLHGLLATVVGLLLFNLVTLNRARI